MTSQEKAAEKNRQAGLSAVYQWTASSQLPAMPIFSYCINRRVYLWMMLRISRRTTMQEGWDLFWNLFYDKFLSLWKLFPIIFFIPGNFQSWNLSTFEGNWDRERRAWGDANWNRRWHVWDCFECDTDNSDSNTSLQVWFCQQRFAVRWLHYFFNIENLSRFFLDKSQPTAYAPLKTSWKYLRTPTTAFWIFTRRARCQ